MTEIPEGATLKAKWLKEDGAMLVRDGGKVKAMTRAEMLGVIQAAITSGDLKIIINGRELTISETTGTVGSLPI
jgi:hypothetical protein